MKKTLTLYLGVFIFFSLCFIGLFHTPLFSSQKVLFYRGILLLVITFFIALGIGIWKKSKYKIKTETYIAALVMSASLNLVSFVVFPVTFDRSVTMYLLNTLNTKQTATCKGLPMEDLESNFIREFVQTNKAIPRRVYEQSLINTLHEKDNCISLTDSGQNFLRLSEFLKFVYHIQ